MNSADSRTHNFFYSNDATLGLSQLMRDAVNYARVTSYDPTVITTVDSPVQGADTDVVAFDWDISGFWCGVNWHYPNVPPNSDVKVGMTICMGLSVSVPGACEQFYVDFDTSFTDTTGVWFRIALACHELGHTLGLVHESGNTCMVQNLDANKAFISGSDATWINNNY